MTLIEFARLVRDCRAVQREYFDVSKRKPDSICRAREAERRVDREIERILGGQATFFDRETRS